MIDCYSLGPFIYYWAMGPQSPILSLNHYSSGIELQILRVSFGVDFSYCWINVENLRYSLEQYIGFVVRQAFIHYCGLHQVWREAEN